MVLGEIFFTGTPWRCTRSGTTGRPSDTRFCTSTWAMLASMPSLKVTISV